MKHLQMPSSTPSPEQPDRVGLSYKFQRLREKLRQAIASGELSGKLPGERALAKRFHVNAKTLSKALTDLAAEGLLDRSIGRGTYVKGHSPAKVASKRWLLVCEPQQISSDVIQSIRAAHPELDVVTDIASLRPSFLNQFSAVIDLASNTSESFLRDLVVRNIPVVVVGKEPRVYSTHAVLFDGPLAVSQLGRDLLLSGHRRIAAVEPRSNNIVAQTLHRIIPRYAPDAQVEICDPADATTMFNNGITAFVCQSIKLAQQVKQNLDAQGIPVPQGATLVAVGRASDEQSVSGYFLARTEKAKAIVHLLSDSPNSRPATLWLTGRYIERGTLAPLNGLRVGSMSSYNTASA